MDTGAAHVYFSTGCLHGQHGYCQSMTGQQGEKRPGRCKFCDAQCICPCHQDPPLWQGQAPLGALVATAARRQAQSAP